MKLIIILFSLFAVSLVSRPTLAFNPLGDACSNAGGNGAVCQQNKSQFSKGTNPAIDKIRSLANLIALLSGIVAVVIIIYSGLQFITAGGAITGQRAGDNPQGARKARSTLSGAVIGLIIIALAWTIITVILNLLT